MTVFLVIQQGVYRHDIRGVYTTLNLAHSAADRCRAEDEDDYHSYVIAKTGLDEYVGDVAEIPGTTRLDQLEAKWRARRAKS